MDTIEFKSDLTKNDKNSLIERITTLSENDRLVLRGPESIEPVLVDMKKRRFQGLDWSAKVSGNFWQFEVTNKIEDDCCGCCGGS